MAKSRCFNGCLVSFVFFVLGGLIGYVSWGHSLFLTSFAIFVLIGYFLIPKRVQFFVFILGYYLAGSRGLLTGTAVFYNEYIAISVYLSAALLSSFAWIIFWGYNTNTKVVSFLLTQAILILPPVGLIAWINPMLVSGLFFGGFGFLGFFVLLIIVILIAQLSRFSSSSPILFFSLISVLSLLFGLAYVANPKIDYAIEAINSNEQYETGTVAPLVDFTRQMKYLKDTEKTDKNIVLLPESALGFVTPTNDIVWQNTSKTVFAGAMYWANQTKYINGLYIIENGKIRLVYKQRVPVLISMWKPWSNNGANANIFGQSGFRHNDEQYGVLVCYEQLIMLPVIQTMFDKPDTILAISNLWWAKDTSILKIEEQTIQLWALLFDKPYVFSYNQ